MSNAIEIRVPLDNVNDDTVKLTAWLVKEGDEVKEGQLFAELETSKALVEIIAPASGRAWLRAKAGDEVRVGSVIAFITDNGSRPPSDLESKTSVSARMESRTIGQEIVAPEGTTFSKKALELIEQAGISVEKFAGRGLVREQDVKEYLTTIEPTEGVANLHIGLKGVPVDQITFPAIFSDSKRGFVDQDFLNELRANPGPFAKLPSAEKCRMYREHGANIGERAEIGVGTIIIAPQIVIGAEARLDQDSSIVCRERFCVGALTSFGRNLNVRGGTVVIGQGIWAGQNIRIGGGGHADPWSILSVGDSAYLGDDLYINICRAILIGTEVFLTQRSILMTHNIGHSLLDGYENRFAPVVLGDYSQVGMQCTVYAGTVIGRGAIVGSNSYVISSIPEGKLAIGVPARVVRNAIRAVEPERQLQLVRGMIREFHELLKLKGHAVGPLVNSPNVGFSLEYPGKHFQFYFVEMLSGAKFPEEPADEIVVWTMDANSPDMMGNCSVMDLKTKQVSGRGGIFSNSAREFLRKRGIRCKPQPWRYRGGLI